MAAFPAPFKVAGDAAGGGGPGMAAVGRVRGAFHWAVEGRSGVHGGGFVAIVGVSRWALDIVHWPLRRSRRRRR